MIRFDLPHVGSHRTAATGVQVLALLASGLFTGCAEQPSQSGALKIEVVEQHWPDGGLHVRRTVMTTGDGRRLNHGPLTVWYETGEPRSEGHWHDGRKHGHFVFWHQNGRKAKEFTWSDGRGNGVFIAWDEQGVELRRELWRHGQRIQVAVTASAATASEDSVGR
jgi:hypothetical protein